MGYTGYKMVKGSIVLQTIHDKELLVETRRILDVWGLDENSGSDCQKALKEAKKVLKERNENKPVVNNLLST